MILKKIKNNTDRSRDCKGLWLPLRLLYMVGLCSILFSCSSGDSLEPEDVTTSLSRELYINLNLNLSSEDNVTRSGTLTDGSSTNGTYDPFDEESKISKFYLIFCNNEDSYLMHFSSNESIDLSTSANGSKTGTVSIPVYPEHLKSLINGGNMHVYLVANITIPSLEGAGTPSFNLKDISYSFPDYNGSYFIGNFPQDGKTMPIINKDYFEVNLSTTQLDEDQIDAFFAGKSLGSTSADELNEKVKSALSSAFQGTITNSKQLKLERMISRFDYKDAGNFIPSGSRQRMPNTFGITTENTSLALRLVAFQPINISKTSYMFRHTSDGTNTGASILGSTFSSISLFGNENGNTSGDTNTYIWVADDDWTAKIGFINNMPANGWTGPVAGGNDYFINQPSRTDFTPSGSWINVETVMSYPDKENSTSNFHPVCYISENTLPSIESMIRGLSTGIAFRTVLCGPDGEILQRITSEDNLKDSDGNPLYEGMIKYIDDNTISIKVNNETATLNYETIDGKGGYYLTYYYFLRHNFNSDDRQDLQPMQFGVVRNNLYRISIKGFNGIPRPYDPQEPDEPEDSDLFVEVRVLPWQNEKVVFEW